MKVLEELQDLVCTKSQWSNTSWKLQCMAGGLGRVEGPSLYNGSELSNTTSHELVIHCNSTFEIHLLILHEAGLFLLYSLEGPVFYSTVETTSQLSSNS